MISTKVDVTAGIPLFKKTLSVGFNSAVTTNHKFDAKYIYGSYNLLIKQRRLRFNATTDMLADYITLSLHRTYKQKRHSKLYRIMEPMLL